MKFLIWFVLVICPIILYAVLRERHCRKRARMALAILNEAEEAASTLYWATSHDLHSRASSRDRGCLLPHQEELLCSLFATRKAIWAKQERLLLEL